MSELFSYSVADWRRQGATLLLWVGPAMLLLFIAMIQPWYPFETLSRDPLAVAASSADCCGYYYGFLSNIGVMFWLSAASVSILAGLVLFQTAIAAAGAVKKSAMREARFFLAAGAVSLAFGLDDLFMIHEFAKGVVPIGEQLVLLGLAICMAAFLVQFRRDIALNQPAFFIAALMALGVSFGADLVADLLNFSMPYKLEDGAKFLGVAAWSAYLVRGAYFAITQQCMISRDAPSSVAPVRKSNLEPIAPRLVSSVSGEQNAAQS